MTMRMLVVLAVGLVSGAAAGEGLVRNGGFDAGTPPRQADGWKLSADWRLSENDGKNGARGLVWERHESRPSSGARQPLALKAGRKYRFSGYVRIPAELTGAPSKDGVKPCACLIVEFRDKANKWLGEAYSARVKDTKDEWVRLEGLTKRVSDDVASATIAPFVWHQVVGKVFFDDIQVEEVEEKTLLALDSDVYRDHAWEGDVTFKALLNFDREADLSAYRLRFAYGDGKIGTKRVDVTDFTHRAATVTLPVSELPLGTLPVTLELRRAATDVVLETVSLTFTRSAEKPQRKCWIDRHNRLIVDGQPFFPLACYTYVLDEKRLDAYGRGAFNTVLPYPYLTRSDFDRIAARGLKVIATLKDCFLGAKHPPTKIESAADADRSFLARLEALKDHPAVIGWYLNDESPVSEMDRLVRQYGYVCTRDGQHPAYSVICQFDQVGEYRPTCDVIGTDPYPIGDKPIGLAAEVTRDTRRDFGGGPIWQVPQAFAWKWWSRGDDVTGRVPTKAEFRSMTWQMIANGANGICAYCFGTLYDRLPRAEFDAVWRDYCDVSREIAAFIPVFLSIEPAPTVTGFPKGLSGRCWRKDGKAYLLLTNETREPVAGELTLSEPFGAPTVCLGGDEANVAPVGGKLAVRLQPLAVAIVSW